MQYIFSTERPENMFSITYKFNLRKHVIIVRRGVKTPPFQKQPPPPNLGNPPFLKIPDPPPSPTFKVKVSSDLKLYS